MRTKHHSPTPNRDSTAARAALEALFGDDPRPHPDSPTPAGDALIARKEAEAKSVSSRIDLLRRKREAMDEILREAARHGLTIEDLRSVQIQG